MEIRLSVVRPDHLAGATDIRVLAPAGATLADVERDLLAAVGADGQPRAIFCDGHELARDAPLGQGPLLEGAVLSVGRPGGAAGRVAGTVGGLLELHAVGGPDAGMVHRLAPGVHRIGRAGESVLVVDDPDVSRLHAELAVTAAGITVTDLGSTNGTRVDGQRIHEPVAVTELSRVVVGSTTLVLRVPRPEPAATVVRAGLVEVNRAPRVPAPVRPVTLQRPSPPAPRREVRVPLVAVLVPLALAVPLALLLGSWYYLLFGLLSPAMLLGNLAGDRVTGRREHRAATAAHEQDLVRVERQLGDALRLEQLRRRAAAPDAAEVLCTATSVLRRIWERAPADDDFLDLRLGTATLPSRVTVLPAAGAAVAGVRTDGPDPDHPVVPDVPVVLALADLGVAGLAGPRRPVLALARSLVGQVATLHSPRHAGLVVLVADPAGGAPDASAADWSWTGWLPHSRPVDGLGAGAAAVVGLDAEQRRRRVAELVALLDARLEQARASAVGRRRFEGRHVVLVLDGAQRLRGEPGVARLLDLGPSVGITALCLDHDAARLPAECRGTVVVGGEVATRLRVDGADPVPDDVVADLVPQRWAHRLARALAPLRDATPEAGSGVPDQVRLLDLLDLHEPTPDAVAGRWSAAPRSTSTVLGAGAGGPVTVDLRRDGPHALVAGTTGSGKSELLQSLVAGLAVANRPDEMVFVLIDYKGGAAFARCAQLPHTVGLVTDLDGALTARALTSLGAEVGRRERLLAAAGAADLDAYVTLRDRAPREGRLREGRLRQGSVDAAPGLPPLPRLVLVVDEFRVLAEELPDFVSGLVRLAAVGRSLGLHLVLATQRPAGVVSAEITANTNLRVALRVQEASDSLDVVDTTAAASLPVTAPGRALLRRGSQPLVELQTARVAGAGGSGPVGVQVQPLLWARAGDPLPVPAAGASGGRTDLDDLVDAVRAAADLAGCVAPPSPWLAPLPPAVALGSLGPVAAPPGGLVLPFGLLDEPAAQRRGTAAWDLLADGPLAVVGGPRSGRTTLVRALLGSLTTCAAGAAGAADGADHDGGAAWVYLLDGSGALAGAAALPQVGAVVDRDDTERTLRLLDLLHEEVGRRQTALARQGAADLAEQRRRAADLGEAPLPWVVLAVDGWEAVQAAAEQAGALRVVDGVLHLLRQGPAVGVLTVVTGGRSVLSGQVGAALSRRVVLRTTDTGDAVMAGVPSRAVPATWAPGRALLVHDDAVLQAQVALLADDPSGGAQAAALAALAAVAGAAPATGAAGGPPPVPPMPTRVALADVPAPPDPASTTWLPLGVGGPRVEPLGWDPAGHGAVLLVAGHPGSGRSTTLAVLGAGAVRARRPVVVVPGHRSPLEQVPGVVVVDPDDDAGLGTALAAARSAGTPALVLLDDVEFLDDRRTHTVLAGLVADLVAGRAGGAAEAVAAAGSTPDLLTRYGGLAVQLRRPGTGVLLGPAAPTDGDLLGVRLGRAAQRAPGRGALVRRGGWIPLQVALP